jgi:hypothetical protein
VRQRGLHGGGGILQRLYCLLDGDDYWTSDNKLQKSADYLDQHPGAAICFHNVEIVSDDPSGERHYGNTPEQPARCTFRHLLEGCFIYYCSAMVRRTAIGAFPSWYRNEHSPDWALFIMASQNGSIGYLDEVMAAYRAHASGYWTGLPSEKQLERVLGFYENLRGFLPEEHSSDLNFHTAKVAHEIAREYERKGVSETAAKYREQSLLVEPDSRKVKWRLRTAGQESARLVLPIDEPRLVRVVIDHLVSKASYDIQLSYPYQTARKGQSYAIRFQARADRERHVFLGFSQAHESWSNLGLYRKIELTPQWQAFQESFIATADDAEARIHFDAGEHSTSFEISHLELTRTWQRQRSPGPRTAAGFHHRSVSKRGQFPPGSDR